ncbi:MAG: hypothetical protein IJJ61_03090 [Clostridia bacterium]|nr:hypothetical protein [Clostridia bacterium]
MSIKFSDGYVLTEEDEKIVFNWLKRDGNTDETTEKYLQKLIEDEFTFEFVLKEARAGKPYNWVLVNDLLYTK